MSSMCSITRRSLSLRQLSSDQRFELQEVLDLVLICKRKHLFGLLSYWSVLYGSYIRISGVGDLAHGDIEPQAIGRENHVREA